MRHTLIVAVAALLCLASVSAQEPALQEKTGLKVGQKAPAFKLRDQTDKQQTFDDLAKNADYVALVFYRSANW